MSNLWESITQNTQVLTASAWSGGVFILSVITAFYTAKYIARQEHKKKYPNHPRYKDDKKK